MKAGQHVICVDDEGWLIPDAGVAPVKNGHYVIRDAELFGSVLAVSLVGFDPEGFYRACRFRPLQSTITNVDEQITATDPASAGAR